MKKPIVLIINSLEGGGAERVFSKLAMMLDENEYLQEYFHLILLDRLDEKYSLPSNVKIDRIGLNSLKILQFFKLIVLLIKLNPQKVVSFLTRSNIFAILGASILNYEVIISERADRMGQELNVKERFIAWFIAWLYSRADKIVAVSEGVAKSLIKHTKVHRKQLIVIENPYNHGEIVRLAEQSTFNQEEYIIAIGRLVKGKCFDLLIKAYQASGITAKLKILGQGPELLKLQSLVEDLDLSDRVDFMGFVDNPYPIIKDAKFYVSASRREGFPNTMLESMILGKPVISTNCKSGPLDILNAGVHVVIPKNTYSLVESGILVNVDDEAGLTSAINRLCNDESLLSSLEAKSCKRSADFSDKIFFDKFKKTLLAPIE
jgi:N-acetylgalactosamine-N,N'-diacetylbacillosaminyl-diphospho-undecaprenol 4-alpha-N-acetylgalactosaminyltransferase